MFPWVTGSLLLPDVKTNCAHTHTHTPHLYSSIAMYKSLHTCTSRSSSGEGRVSMNAEKKRETKKDYIVTKSWSSALESYKED